MIVVGGVTRLTHSGLSIVEWQPLVGTLPPMSADQWWDVFEKYKKTPEFREVNFNMGLQEFKGIFWWEYFHRLIGRLIGVAFLVPYLYFIIRRRVSGSLAWKLGGIFVLGGLQGAWGWYMVQSGLVDNPRVSHYRLTAHLGLALLIYAAMFWVALDLLFPRRRAAPDSRPGLAAPGIVILVFVMSLTGGLVAGIRAGYAFNTFPLMNGHLIPPDLFLLEPWYRNFFDNMATVQFDHRLLAWLLAIVVPLFWWRSRRTESTVQEHFSSNLLLATLALQVSLGIVTLLLVVPISFAAAHQAGAVLLFSAAIIAAHVRRGSLTARR